MEQTLYKKTKNELKYEKNQQIRSSILMGMRREQVIEKHGISPSKYIQINNTNKFEEVQEQLASFIEREKKVATLFEEGHTLEEIGKIFDTTKQNVSLILKKIGINSNEGGVKKKREVQYLQYQAAVEALALKGLDVREISEKLKISRRTVRMVIDKFQIEVVPSKFVEMQKEIAKKDKESIYHMRQLGFTQTEISKALNKSQSYVSAVLVKMDERVRPTAEEFKERDEAIWKIYQNQTEKDMGAIAESYQMTVQNIYRILKKMEREKQNFAYAVAHDLVSI